jgi:hypothetical protein
VHRLGWLIADGFGSFGLLTGGVSADGGYEEPNGECVWSGDIDEGAEVPGCDGRRGLPRVWLTVWV